NRKSNPGPLVLCPCQQTGKKEKKECQLPHQESMSQVPKYLEKIQSDVKIPNNKIQMQRKIKESERKLCIQSKKQEGKLYKIPLCACTTFLHPFIHYRDSIWSCVLVIENESFRFSTHHENIQVKVTVTLPI
ncbi:hypothetical protein STEG23_026903, partial [Scotinomys teguina]